MTEDVTQLLAAYGNGDQSALDQLFPLIYDELRRLASSYMRRERRDHTLQTTALVHEAYIKMVGSQNTPW
ncbi:MAG: ECF-type sigma factor, partial [Blastocatellia bacterium]